MPEVVAFLNTLNATRFDAGAEKVVRLLRQGFEAEEIATRMLSILPPGSHTQTSETTSQQIRSSSVYFPYPERNHRTMSKIAFHILENWNPLAVERTRRIGLIDDATVLFSHNLRGFSTGVWSLQNRSADLIKAHYIHDYQLACTASSIMRNGTECLTPCASCRLLTDGRRRMSANVDIVYGASEYILDYHIGRGFFPRAIAKVIEPPLDLDGQIKRPYVKRPIRRFGFLGRIVKEKGITELLDGFARFRHNLSADDASSAELIIAGGGEGPFFDAQIARVDSMSGVRYAGVMKPHAFFDSVDALVVPSIWPDPNPFVVVEAYQHGLPVIAASVGGLRQSVVNDKTGLLFAHNLSNGGMVSALQRAWDGIPISPDAMQGKVTQRDYRLAINTILHDIMAIRSKTAQ
ncbi:glycosyltransferase involved in cell wall biosynthesis [Sphingomonas faeni]|uniref:Glycosyltransferase involved in cell wall biosynthesis n=2 Tax=Sphingomonas faeni TaxID=185950 RepID=A0A2T5TXI2_9SPHN|nr:glycosyltransferase involved in cell wall biosynthesis [Sphingomonas faeni]